MLLLPLLLMVIADDVHCETSKRICNGACDEYRKRITCKICLFNAVEQDIRETIFLSDPLHAGCSGCTRSTYDIITKIQLSSNLKIYTIHSLKIMCS